MLSSENLQCNWLQFRIENTLNPINIQFYLTDMTFSFDIVDKLCVYRTDNKNQLEIILYAE